MDDGRLIWHGIEKLPHHLIQIRQLQTLQIPQNTGANIKICTERQAVLKQLA